MSTRVVFFPTSIRLRAVKHREMYVINSRNVTTIGYLYGPDCTAQLRNVLKPGKISLRVLYTVKTWQIFLVDIINIKICRVYCLCIVNEKILPLFFFFILSIVLDYKSIQYILCLFTDFLWIISTRLEHAAFDSYWSSIVTIELFIRRRIQLIFR